MYEGAVGLRLCWGFLTLFGCAQAHAGERIALLVANNTGLAGEVPLQHTGDDARRLAGVLREIGHFEADDVQVLVEQSAEQVLQALAQILQRRDAKMLFFYYSGHADASSLHLRGTRLPLASLMERLDGARSPLQLVLLDACQSGAASRAKGSAPGPAFEVRVTEPPITGQIVITSSAADEQSYESDAQRGALFTTHWISGLRGAADRNDDGQVTLAEAYGYAYTQTLRDTLLSGGGPQHPSFRWGFAARQEPVLTYLHSDADLTLHSTHDGVYVVFTPAERDVLAEVPLRAGEQVRLSLPAGQYVIKKHDTQALRAAQIVLARGDDRMLYDRSMIPVPLLHLAQKGGWGEVRAVAGVGQYATGLGPRGLVQATVGAEVAQDTWDFGARLLFSTGTENHLGLQTQETYAGPVLHALRAESLGPYLRAAVGPAVGALYWQQHSLGRAPVHSAAGLCTVMAMLQTHILPRLGVGVRAEGGAMLARAEGPLPRLGARVAGLTLLPWAAYTVEVQLAW